MLQPQPSLYMSEESKLLIGYSESPSECPDCVSGCLDYRPCCLDHQTGFLDCLSGYLDLLFGLIDCLFGYLVSLLIAYSVWMPVQKVCPTFCVAQLMPKKFDRVNDLTCCLDNILVADIFYRSLGCPSGCLNSLFWYLLRLFECSNILSKCLGCPYGCLYSQCVCLFRCFGFQTAQLSSLFVWLPRLFVGVQKICLALYRLRV